MPALIADVEDQLAPLDDDSLQTNLTALMAALGAGMPQKEKSEWIATAMITLGQFPAALCQEALHLALTDCTSVRQVLNFVKEYCEDYPARMRQRLEKIQRLQAIAEDRDHV